MGYDNDSYKFGPFAQSGSLIRSDGFAHFCRSLLWIGNGNFIGHRVRWASMVELIETKAHQMLGDVGTEEGYGFRINPVSLTHQLVHSPRQDGHIGKDHKVGEEMIVFEIFAHLASIIRRNHTSIAKGEPFRETIERLTLVGFSLNNGSKFWIAEVLQQKAGTNHSPQLAERLVQLVLVAVGIEFAKNG